jgi:hypothetical protein
MSSRAFSENLEPLVRCIASKSQLKRLDIKSKAKLINSVGVKGTELLKHIFDVHIDTLQTLKIPSLRLSKILLQRFFIECKNLITLWIGGNQQAMVCGHSCRILENLTQAIRHRYMTYYHYRHL